MTGLSTAEKIAFLTNFAKAFRDFNVLLEQTSQLFHEVEETADHFDELIPVGGYPIEAFGEFLYRDNGMMFFQSSDGQILPICRFEFQGDAETEATGLNHRFRQGDVT